jgi:nucleoside-diphosphate-sugar epimerase
VVAGNAQDPCVVGDAMAGVDAVIHLAARPSPRLAAAEEVFTGNARATFVVLEEAGKRGVRRAAIASSFAVCGLPFATRPLSLPYLPVDTDMPARITDPYALSKQADEATAAMMALRHSMSVAALRLPFVGTADELSVQWTRYHGNPAAGASDVWSYLDVRDAARAMFLACCLTGAGSHVVYVAAAETLSAHPTAWLLDRYHPAAPRRSTFPGRTVPIDLRPAEGLLGFAAEHTYLPD